MLAIRICRGRHKALPLSGKGCTERITRSLNMVLRFQTACWRSWNIFPENEEVVGVTVLILTYLCFIWTPNLGLQKWFAKNTKVREGTFHTCHTFFRKELKEVCNIQSSWIEYSGKEKERCSLTLQLIYTLYWREPDKLASHLAKRSK